MNQGSLVHEVVGLLVQVKQNAKKGLVTPSDDESQIVGGSYNTAAINKRTA